MRLQTFKELNFVWRG